MKFYTNEIYTDTVEINTLAELRAYALGGTGTIQIDFAAIDEVSGSVVRCGVIRKINEEPEE